jgi:hypothetical protein
MILKLDNPLVIPKILELSKLVPDVKYEVLKGLLIPAVNDPDSAIYYDDKDGVINGFIFCSKLGWDGKDVCFIQFAVNRPSREEKYIGFELLTKVRLWARDKGLKEMVASVRRDPKGFERRYKFVLDSYLLKRMV